MVSVEFSVVSDAFAFFLQPSGSGTASLRFAFERLQPYRDPWRGDAAGNGGANKSGRLR